MDQLLGKGANDVYYTPIYMEKNRPAYMIGVICSEELLTILEEVIFTHTTTIGVRKHEDTRTTLQREFKTVTTSYGCVIVKVCRYNQNIFYYTQNTKVLKRYA